MPYVDVLPRETLEIIASQIGERLGAEFSVDTGDSAPLQLGESFPVWALGLDATTHFSEDLSGLAVITGLWHHQIHQAGNPVGFARSRSTGPAITDWQVQDVTLSSIAERLYASLEWMERQPDMDLKLVLLVIPAYYMHCFWLIEGARSQVVIADRPEQYTNLPVQTRYSSEEFLKELAQTPDSGGGIPLLPAL